MFYKRRTNCICRQNPKQMHGWPLGRFQIFRIIAWLQESRHAVVDPLHEFAGDDGEGALPLIGLRVLPAIPDAPPRRMAAGQKE